MNTSDFVNGLDALHQSPDQHAASEAPGIKAAETPSPAFQLKSAPVQKSTANPEEKEEREGRGVAMSTEHIMDDPPPIQKPGNSVGSFSAPPFQLKTTSTQPSINNVLQRAPNAPAAEEKDKITGKFSLQNKLGEKEYSYAQATSSYKAEAEYCLNVPKSVGAGSHDVTIGKKDGKNGMAIKKELEQKAKEKYLGVDWSVKEGAEFNSQGGELAVEGGFEGDRLFGSLKFVPFSIGEGKDKKTEIKFLNLAVEMGLKAFEGKDVPVSFIAGATLDYKFKGSVVVEIEPNLKRIALEIAKKAGLQLAEGLALDMGAVGFAAAAIALPALAAGMMIAGAVQTEKNITASHAASRAGTIFRQEARTYAQDYAKTITGGTGKGKGGAAAENVLTMWCMANGGTRESAVAAAIKSNGNYGAIYQSILKTAKDKYYTSAVAEFNSKNKEEFGIVESFGDDWGMKGVFQNDLKRILYADDFN